jgi:hypothetical protein
LLLVVVRRSQLLPAWNPFGFNSIKTERVFFVGPAFFVIARLLQRLPMRARGHEAPVIRPIHWTKKVVQAANFSRTQSTTYATGTKSIWMDHRPIGVIKQIINVVFYN